ncbi:MAG: hypothetical protein R2690_11535 [Acidimicrobiales bacterium]
MSVGDTKLVAYVFGVDGGMGAGGGGSAGAAGVAEADGEAAGVAGAVGRGGPGEVVEGRPPGPARCSTPAALRSHVGVGDEVEVFGVERRVAGLSEGLTSVACTGVPVGRGLRRRGRTRLNYVLAGATLELAWRCIGGRRRRRRPRRHGPDGEAFSAEEAPARACTPSCSQPCGCSPP